MESILKQNIPLIVVFVLLLVITIFIMGKTSFNRLKTYSSVIYNHMHDLCVPTQQQQVKDKDFYNSGEGFLTSVWGPLIWPFLHIISFNYKVNPTQEDKENYRAFITNLQHVLPCKYCRISFGELLRDQPLTDDVMESRESFSRWMYKAHNLVNIRTKKPIYKTYEQVRDFYEEFRSKCSSSVQKKEIGCVRPLYKKQKCQILFVPQ